MTLLKQMCLLLVDDQAVFSTHFVPDDTRVSNTPDSEVEFVELVATRSKAKTCVPSTSAKVKVCMANAGMLTLTLADVEGTHRPKSKCAWLMLGCSLSLELCYKLNEI